MLGQVQMSYLAGAADGRYMKWVIVDPSFWTIASAPVKVVDMLDTLMHNSSRDPNSIYVELTDGGPIGHYIMHLINKPRYVAGLFIQAYGVENEVPCRVCEQRFVKSDIGKKSGMWPYFGCKSIPGFAEHACGNCVGTAAGHNCTFTDKTYAHLRAVWDRKPPIVSDITDRNSPPHLDAVWTNNMLTDFLKSHDKYYSR